MIAINATCSCAMHVKDADVLGEALIVFRDITAAACVAQLSAEMGEFPFLIGIQLGACKCRTYSAPREPGKWPFFNACGNGFIYCTSIST